MVNQGGLITPVGTSAGTHIMGDLEIQAGAIAFNIGGTAAGEFDKLVVDGHLAAGGTLQVRLAEGFSPAAGDSFDVLDFSSLTGAFTCDLPPLNDGLAWNTADLPSTGALSVAPLLASPADFNGDGIVNGDDLHEWRQGFGAIIQPSNSTGDADSDGDVDGRDLLAWQRARNAGGAGASASVKVPEPGTWALAVLSSSLLCRRQRAACKGHAIHPQLLRRSSSTGRSSWTTSPVDLWRRMRLTVPSGIRSSFSNTWSAS
jgi:hypothetical protein